ncbi:MAG: DNA repair protein RecO [Saprospiraceae bacterium]|nr:DNA repair protein RecO [Saprospiraceae bacterium]
MIVKTRGIILRTVKYSETSIIADIYTEGGGLRSYIISGVRTQRSKVAMGLLQVMSLVDIVAYDVPNKLNRIKEIQAAHVYTSLPFDIRKSSIGLFMAEVARRTIRESEENAELFQFLFDIFKYLDETHERFSNLHLAFLLELSGHLGFRPDEGEYTEGAVFDLRSGIFTKNSVGHSHFLSENHSFLLSQLLTQSWHQSHLLKISLEERRLLIGELLKFYQFHLDNFPDINSFKILQEIF